MDLKKTISEFFFNTYLQNGPFDSWTSLMYIISDWRSFLYDFWQFNKSSWQIKWLCWQLNCTANQYFQLLSLSFRKNTTWGHTVVKPRKENKARSNQWGGGSQEGRSKLQGTACHPALWAWGTQGFWHTSGKWHFPWGDSLRLYNGDFSLLRSYLKVIRFEPWSYNILLKGPLFRLSPSCYHPTLSSPERPSRTAGNVSQPLQGSTGQSKKAQVWECRGRGQPSSAFQRGSSKSIFSNVYLSCGKRGYPWRSEQTQKYSSFSLSREYK